ncbi:MAG: hypothetical protein SGJ20_06515 [Planctomycetota bacterium]|nr:hypothetical protein [Planctomycetota bacterium]
MATDHYAFCPGGTGKKLKFCPCCSDILPDLEKIERLLQSDQTAAAVTLVDQLLLKHPGRPSLLSWKIMLELAVGNVPAIAQTAEEFLRLHPENPVALADNSLVKASQGEIAAALDLFQTSLEQSDVEIPEQVFSVLGMLIEILLELRQNLPAKGLTFFMLMLTKGKYAPAAQWAFRLESDPDSSVLFKDPPEYPLAPESAPWRNSFNEAITLAAAGLWRTAIGLLESLSNEAADFPPLWSTLANLHCNMANYAAAASALRRLAAVTNDHAEAVEAEAKAQLLDPSGERELVDMVLVTYEVADLDQVDSLLAKSPNIDRAYLPPKQNLPEGGPPPRSTYYLLDRPVVKSGANLSQQDIPCVLASLLLFGKQTDRPARLVIEGYKPQLSATQDALRSIVGDAIGPIQDEAVLGQLYATQYNLSWQWRVPDDISAERYRELTNAQRKSLLLNVWPKCKQFVLGNRTPQEAAADPSARLALEAAILILQLGDAEASMADAYTELRQQLGLPQPQPIDASTVNIDLLPAARLSLVIPQSLSDEQLARLLTRLAYLGNSIASVRMAEEVLRRGDVVPAELRLSALRQLLGNADEKIAVQYITEGRQLAKKIGQSAGTWDLAELGLRVQQQDRNEIIRLLKHIQTVYANEEAIMQGLASVLVRAGMITQDGRIMLPPPKESAPSLVVPGSESGSSLWTPDSDSGSQGKPAGLWLPD